MTDFCLLAVSLLNQGQMPGWKLAASDQLEQTSQLGQANAANLATQNCPSSTKGTIASAEVQQPEFSPVLRTSSIQPQPVTPPQSVTVLPQRLPLTAATPTLPELEATAYLPDPTPLNAAEPRPFSGSQLYQQRVAALRAGTLYTRSPLDSYRSDWINATLQPTYEQWISLLTAEARAIARGQGANRLTVMVGDSLYLWYPREQLSSDRFWLNQGISGDTTAGVLRRLSAFAQTRPDTIHVMVGINDLRQGATDTQVLNNSRQIMHQLRQQHPGAQIFVQSILPTRLAEIPSSRIRHLNEQLALMTQQENVNYIDLQSYFADTNGNLRADLTTDGLHLSPRGYAVWQTALQAFNHS